MRRAAVSRLIALVAITSACSGSTKEAGEAPWFAEIAAEAGIDFRHESGARGMLYMPEIMGGGVGLFDADGDGDLDAYLANGNRLLPDTSPSADDTGRLYVQRPDGSFEDRTSAAGLRHGGFGMGVAVGDVDNDSDLDLFLTNYGPDVLFRNRGDGTFEDVTASAGIDVAGWSTSATFFDYDRDGFLDLYVARYLVWEPTKSCTSAAGRRDYCGPTAFPPARHVLLHNRGDGTFEDVSLKAGILAAAAPGLGVVSDDFDGDGWADLYVANDGFANMLWLNKRDGTFTDEAVILGAAYDARGIAHAGMGVVSADFDNDLAPDLFVTNLEFETNTLYRGLGPGRGFADVTEAVGLGPDSWRRTGFGTVALDVELDGDLDLFVANGRVTMGEPQPGCSLAPPWDALAEPSLFYFNDGSGRFALAGREVFALTGRIEVSRGVAAGDVDGDGDVDLLVGAIHGRTRLYRNGAPRTGRVLAVRAVDPALHREAIGARVTVVLEGGGRQMRTIARGFSYLSSSSAVAHFGLPGAGRLERIEVRWPDGLGESFHPGPDAAPTLLLLRGEGTR